ncbi:MAG: HU family DNA-binding protein [Erysipelotrichia bacterium]|nr:HU family DNA-binding protein [Erysipelotrichia bacterium]
MEKLTKKQIVDAIAEDSNATKKEITAIVDSTLSQISNALSEGKEVDLTGFGKFSISERQARQGINPLTKEKIEIAASKSVKFKVAKALKEAVNK